MKYVGVFVLFVLIYNVDVRKFKFSAEDKVDVVLTSCSYSVVYDYLLFVCKVCVGSGVVVLLFVLFLV